MTGAQASTTAPDPRELLRACQENNDQAARDKLVSEYMPLVASLARRYGGRGEQLDDLIQVGAIGLLKAIDRFDVDRGVEFTTYAVPTIVGEIKRHFRDKVWPLRVPRPLHDLHRRLTSILDELSATLGRSPTIAEIAAAAQVPEEDVVEALEVKRAFALQSLSAGIENEDGLETPLLESIADDDPVFDTADDRLVLADGLRKLGKRERVILHMRFYSGMTQSQIAAELGISQMHVSRLIRRALENLGEDLGKASGTGTHQ